MEARQKVRGIATEDGMAKLTLLDLADRPGMAAEVFAPLAEAGIPVDAIIQNVGHDGAADLSFMVAETDLPAAERLLRARLPELRARDLAVVSWPRQGQHRRLGHPQRARLIRHKMFSALGAAGINIEMITTSEIRITCVIESSQLATAARALHQAFELEQA